MHVEFPVEFVVVGTPVSMQAHGKKRLSAWKNLVERACRAALPTPHFASGARIEVTMYYFPAEPMDGDLDNIIKPILDALSGCVIIDDRQVDRLVVQRFDRKALAHLPDMTEQLNGAVEIDGPALYVCLRKLAAEADDDIA